MKKKIAGIVTAIVLLLASNPVHAESAQGAEEKITINLASRILTFWRDGKKVSMYPIAAGKQETQTPIGDFSVIEMEVNPEWVDPKDMKKKVESGEENPLGYRWMGIGGYYGIHGTNRPESIGNYVSNGCIRMKEENVEELFELTDIGTPVEIDYERVVVERLADGRVAYYIYPDGYHLQHLDVSTVKRALAEFGVDDLVSDAEIKKKIENSDGEPTFLPCTYRIEINDLWISRTAVQKGKTVYVPIASLSALTKLPVVSDWDARTLSTQLGVVPGEYFDGAWYVALENTQALFGLSGAVEKDSILRLRSIAQPTETQPQTKNPPQMMMQPKAQTTTQSGHPVAEENAVKDKRRPE